MKIDMAIEWIKASNDDLKTISHILKVADLSHVIAFHSQQSIEKSLKALMEHKNLKVPKQHDLLRLVEIVKSDLTIDDYDILDTLNALYIDSRYPGDMGLLPYGKPSLEDAKEFYRCSKDIFEKVCEILSIDLSDVYV